VTTAFHDRFKNRNAVITGAASGSGKATARRIVEEGGQVALWDVNAEALEAAKQETGAKFSVALDISDASQVTEAAAASNAALGHIDLLLCSAGITGATVPVQDFPIESWQRVIDINLNGVFYCCRAVVPYLLKNGYGRIVNVASVAGKEGNPNASAYSAAKAGVIGFTKSLGKELATRGILANVVTPAAFRSPLLGQMPQSQIDYMASKIPMGRLGEVSEVTALVCWLLSEECSFSTAATFDISGGRTTY
jgi:NAD(P)-dependent dehydrogenase (short-subunit alcohol dehydrogenase family)